MSSTSPMPIVTTTEGLRIANFSSPHSFEFTDGTILPACEADRVENSSLTSVEEEIDNGRWTDIRLRFEMNDEVKNLVTLALALWYAGQVDIIIVPFPVLKALHITGDHPFRTIRCADRTSKVNYHNKFCI